jgi:hypothetical protein
VSVVERCKFLLAHGLNAFRHWFAHLEVLVFVHLGIVSGWECCPLACRHGRVCVGWVVIPPCYSMHVLPSFPCAHAWCHSSLLPGLRACIRHQWCG